MYESVGCAKVECPNVEDRLYIFTYNKLLYLIDFICYRIPQSKLQV